VAFSSKKKKRFRRLGERQKALTRLTQAK